MDVQFGSIIKFLSSEGIVINIFGDFADVVFLGYGKKRLLKSELTVTDLINTDLATYLLENKYKEN